MELVEGGAAGVFDPAIECFCGPVARAVRFAVGGDDALVDPRAHHLRRGCLRRTGPATCLSACR